MAASRGYHEIVRILVDWKPKLRTIRAGNGDLPLHRAAAFGRLRAVDYLSHSDDINLHGNDGKTALHYAIVHGNVAVVKCLLDHGADVNAGDQSYEDYKSPLIVALEAQNDEIVEILLDFGAHIESQDEKGWRPIHFAANRGRTALAHRLLNMGCASEPLTDEGATPLFIALSQNYVDVVDLLWTHTQGKTLQLSHSGATYGHLAAQRGSLDSIHRLLKLDKKIFEQADLDGNDSLLLAAAAGQSKVVDLLLSSGIDPNGPNTSCGTVLTRATQSGSIKTVKTLLSKGAKVNETGLFKRTALIWAVSYGLPRMTQELLKAGANPFVKDAMVCSHQGFALSRPGHHDQAFAFLQ